MQFRYPEVLSMEQQVAHLVLRQVFLRNFLDYDQAKVPVKIVVVLVKVLVDGYGIRSRDVISMFIGPFIHSLGLYLSNVLFLITFQAKAKVNCISRPAARSVSDFIPFSCPVGEKICRNYVAAAHAVTSALTGAAPTSS